MQMLARGRRHLWAGWQHGARATARAATPQAAACGICTNHMEWVDSSPGCPGYKDCEHCSQWPIELNAVLVSCLQATAPGNPDKRQRPGVAIRGTPTRVVLLRNMVGPGDVDDDLEDEVSTLLTHIPAQPFRPLSIKCPRSLICMVQSLRA